MLSRASSFWQKGQNITLRDEKGEWNKKKQKKMTPLKMCNFFLKKKSFRNEHEKVLYQSFQGTIGSIVLALL